jgi:MFS superfamily sulfate permease-like transporter
MIESAGGHSQLSQLTTSFIVLIVLLFFTGPLAYMPAAVLSSVVFLICVELVDIKGMYKIYRERPWEFWVALITAAVVIFVGVEQSIILAIFLSLVVHTRHGYRPNNMIIVPDEPQGGWLLKPVRVQEQTMPALIIYRFMHNMYYANMQALTEEVVTLARGAHSPRYSCGAGYQTCVFRVNGRSPEGICSFQPHRTVRHGRILQFARRRHECLQAKGF